MALRHWFYCSSRAAGERRRLHIRRQRAWTARTWGHWHEVMDSSVQAVTYFTVNSAGLIRSFHYYYAHAVF